MFASYTYDAWGKVTSVTNNTLLDIGNLNPFRYRSYYYDTETSLYYLETRYYDPDVGRFISPDSIEYLDPTSINGLNLYAYCGNNPVMYSDPSGNSATVAILVCIAAGALIGGSHGAYTAYTNKKNIFDGMLTGALLGASVGAIVGIGGSALASTTLAKTILSGALSSTFSKATTDLIGVVFYGEEFSTWEDYAIAFVFGGLTAPLGNVVGSHSILAKASKYAIEVAFRPAISQLVKANTRGESLNRDKYIYDIISRGLTYGGTNLVFKSNFIGINFKIDFGKCYYRSSLSQFY